MSIFKKGLAVVLALAAIAAGFCYWYMLPVQIITRTVEQDYKIFLAYLQKDPTECETQEIVKVDRIYTQRLGLIVDDAMRKLQKAKLSKIDKQQYQKRARACQKMAEGLRVDKVQLCSENDAYVHVVNGRGETVSDLVVKKEDGKWKVDSDLFEYE